jgi:hypothetical protein
MVKERRTGEKWLSEEEGECEWFVFMRQNLCFYTTFLIYSPKKNVAHSVYFGDSLLFIFLIAIVLSLYSKWNAFSQMMKWKTKGDLNTFEGAVVLQ